MRTKTEIVGMGRKGTDYRLMEKWTNNRNRQKLKEGIWNWRESVFEEEWREWVEEHYKI